MGIKTVIWKLAGKVFQSKWYPNKKILLESNPDMGSQTYPVFKYIVDNGLNEKYKIIWIVSDKNAFKHIKIKNVSFINYSPKGKLEKLKFIYANCTARVMLYSHKYIGKYFDKQILIYLRHGSFIKSRLLHASFQQENQCDACVCMSHFFDKFEPRQLGVSLDKFIYTNYPTNDYLFVDRNYVKCVFPGDEYKKVIMWLPTFRKANNSDRIDSKFEFPLGIPCLYTKEQCEEVNEVLKKYEILLVLKPHPGQDLSIVKQLNLSNLKLIYDSNITNAGIHLYQFLGSTDAMITDYSSVYYDYLLTGNPIGISIDDIESYTADTGFAFDNFYDVVVGEYMKDYHDLISFIEHVSDGNDVMAEKRNAVCDMVHESQKDNQSTKRVYDNMIRLLKERYGEI